MALADPADTLAWVRLVVGGSVYGLLGTDGSGRDLAEGLAFGLPVALLIGLAAATVSTAIGTGLGLLSGYKGGRVDLLIQRTADVVNNVPLLPLLIFFVFVLGAQLWLILLLLVAFSWPGLTILVRSMVLGLVGQPGGGGGAGPGRLAGPHPAAAHLPAHGALRVHAAHLLRARRSSWPRPASRSWAWATRRCRPGARSSRTASAPAPSSWATGGGSSRLACSSSSRP